MKRKMVIPILTASLLLCTNSVYAANDNELNDDVLLSIIQSNFPQPEDGIEYEFYIDDYGNYCYDACAETMTKDNVVLFSSNKKLRENYDDIVSSLLGLSEVGHQLLDSVGKEKQMFVVKVLDDLHNDNSDLIFCCVDGSVIYNCLEN